MFTYSCYPQFVIKTKVERHDKKQKKSRELLYVDRYYFLNGWNILVLVRLIFNWFMNVYSQYNFFIFNSLYMLVSLGYKF